MLWVGPFTTFHSAFVHANLNWTLGPFKYVLATPVFHRWHHTSQEEGGNTNFAGTFPLWDILFGTYRMPENQLPDNYGVDEQACRPKSADNWPIRFATSIPGARLRTKARPRASARPIDRPIRSRHAGGFGLAEIRLSGAPIA